MAPQLCKPAVIFLYIRIFSPWKGRRSSSGWSHLDAFMGEPSGLARRTRGGSRWWLSFWPIRLTHICQLPMHHFRSVPQQRVMNGAASSVSRDANGLDVPAGGTWHRTLERNDGKCPPYGGRQTPFSGHLVKKWLIWGVSCCCICTPIPRYSSYCAFPVELENLRKMYHEKCTKWNWNGLFAKL